jgi:hypothetical protein
MVLFIFALWQVPAKIRPLTETVPVNGHFLSMYVPVNKIYNLGEKTTTFMGF